jgi:hypothetical protein
VVSVSEWLVGINPSLAVYASPLARAGFGDVHSLLAAEQDEFEELLVEIGAKVSAVSGFS